MGIPALRGYPYRTACAAVSIRRSFTAESLHTLFYVLFSCIYISYLRFLVGSIIMHITGYSVMDNAIYSTWKSKRAAFPHPASRVAYNFSGHPVIHITAQCRLLRNPPHSYSFFTICSILILDKATRMAHNRKRHKCCKIREVIM